MGATQSSTEAAESPTSSSRGLGLGAVGDAVDRWFDVSTDYVCGPNSCSCLLDDGADGSFTVSQASITVVSACLLYTSPSPRDGLLSRMPSSA